MNLKDLISAALEEDIPGKDITTESLGIQSHRGRARLVAKQDLTLSGPETFTAAVHKMDPETHLKWHFEPGARVLSGQCLCTLQGDLVQLLKAERVGLNFLGHLSGVATLTSKFVDEVKHTQCRILDTRKTTPLLRSLEKQAVVDGGGQNHRMTLSDAILIKENHISVAGGISEAIRKAIDRGHRMIEVEVKNIDEVKEALAAGAHRLLLDNMSNADMGTSVQLNRSQAKLEASGNMSLDRVKAVAELGVDFISVGALTHSAPCADVSLIFDWDH